MTKENLRIALINGHTMDELFEAATGQECDIVKAERFCSGDAIIYIPDLDLNHIPWYKPVPDDLISDVISCCYTGDDFIEECRGNRFAAERLFEYVDWQHPSSALDGDGWDIVVGEECCD